MEKAVANLELNTKPGTTLLFPHILARAEIAELCSRDATQYAKLAKCLRDRKWESARDAKGVVQWTSPPEPAPMEEDEQDAGMELLDPIPQFALAVHQHGRPVQNVAYAAKDFEEAGLCIIRGSLKLLAPVEKRTTLVLTDLGGSNTHMRPLVELMSTAHHVADHIRIICCADKSYNNFPLTRVEKLPDGVVVTRTLKDTKSLTDLILIHMAHDWIIRYSHICEELHIVITSNDKLVRDAGFSLLQALSKAKVTKMTEFNPGSDQAVAAMFVQQHFAIPYSDKL